MRKLVALIIGTFIFFQSFGFSDPDKYVYTIDITKVKDDKIMVELMVPEIKESQITFYLPKIIPGTYKEADYGRFAEDLKAFDKKGNGLEVERLDDNTWTISQAKKLEKITYWVNDTYDADMGGNSVYPMAGTNIESGENIVINTSGFFGYFEGKKELPFDIRIIRPEEFYGSTGLMLESTEEYNMIVDPENKTETSQKKEVDIFSVEDYNLLIDSPLMYNKPDTTVLSIANTEVLVSVYSPNGMVSSKYVAENIDEILQAQKEYLGGELPVEKYAFIFYFEELQKLAPVQGALEHSYSSYYYLPEVPQENLLQTLRDVAAHEFFHIVTPLNIHSEEIHYFDFNEPKMSQHLWLYEGVTEYFAGHVQVKYDIISKEEYLNMIRNKMVSSTTQYNDTLPFTDLSKYTLTKYSDQYNNVYQKGALIGMVLDIKLRDLSGGEYGLQDLMKDLSKKYGKDNPFKDENLFSEIEKLTYPEIGDFLRNYVGGNKPLPFEETFKKVGIEYKPSESYMDFTIGNFGVGFNPQSGRIYVTDVSDLNEFGQALGYQAGDVLIKINEKEIPTQPAFIQGFIQNVRDSMEVGKEFTVTVKRKNEEGIEEEVTLRAETIKVERQLLHQVSFTEEPTEEQLALRNAWLEPQE